MRRLHLHRAFTVLAVLLCVVLSLTVAAETKENVREKIKAIRANIPLNSCRGMFRSCRESEDVWGCMRKKQATMEAGECKNLLTGIIACETDAKKATGCSNITSIRQIRRCVRSLLPSEISAECNSTHIGRFFHKPRGRHARSPAGHIGTHGKSHLTIDMKPSTKTD